MESICLITANISQAKTHFKKALKIYEDIWADEPELIEEKYQAIQELYPQAGIALAKKYSSHQALTVPTNTCKIYCLNNVNA